MGTGCWASVQRVNEKENGTGKQRWMPREGEDDCCASSRNGAKAAIVLSFSPLFDKSLLPIRGLTHG